MGLRLKVPASPPAPHPDGAAPRFEERPTGTRMHESGRQSRVEYEGEGRGNIKLNRETPRTIVLNISILHGN